MFVRAFLTHLKLSISLQPLSFIKNAITTAGDLLATRLTQQAATQSMYAAGQQAHEPA